MIIFHDCAQTVHIFYFYIIASTGKLELGLTSNFINSKQEATSNLLQ